MALMSGTTAVVQAPIGFLVLRCGALRFLIVGTSLMTRSTAGMGLATSYWRIALLAMLSGLGNSVIHPADYAILSGSVDASRIGRSFSIHTFVGHVGFAAAPPVTAALIVLIGWRNTLLLVGLVGVPVVLPIIWQSRILVDHRGARQKAKTGRPRDTRRAFRPPALPSSRSLMSSSWPG